MLLAGLPNSVGGITVNRFCASGLSAVQMAADRIRVGEADVMIAAGAESMSMVPMSGNKPSFNPHVFDKRREHRHRLRHGPDGREGRHAVEGLARGAGRVRAGLAQKAIKAIADGEFKDEITPVEVFTRTPNLATGEIDVTSRMVDTDEGPRPDTSLEGLAKLKAVFARQGQRSPPATARRPATARAA